MKFQELQNKDHQELHEMLKEHRIALGKLRFELVNKSLKNVSQLSKHRKAIAQIFTAMNAKRNK